MLYHNGRLVKKMKMLGYNEIMVGKMFKLQFSRNLEGFISDFNIFSRFFDENENIRWTTCQSFAKGDIFAWNREVVEKFSIVESGDDDDLVTDITEVDENEICARKGTSEYKIELFYAGPISNFEADTICQQMNGIFHLLPETSIEIELLKDAMISYNAKANIRKASPWIGGTIRRENTVKDYYPPSGTYQYRRRHQP